MNSHDLEQLDRLVLAPAARVVSMRQIHEGLSDENVIGLRHDVDDNPGAIDTAVKMAEWEAIRGYRSTYFVLHTASYWSQQDFHGKLEAIESFGHEIGIHANAIPAAFDRGGTPAGHLSIALQQLRSWGHEIIGVAPHGDKLCYENGVVTFVNDEIFTECARPELGAADRDIVRGDRLLKLNPHPLEFFGLEYETYRLPHARYLSDSGGNWNTPLEQIASEGQLHVLQHPDWWALAFKEGM